MSAYTQTVTAQSGRWRMDCDCDGNFASVSWGTEADAILRGLRHEHEHDTGRHMPPETVTARGAFDDPSTSLFLRWAVDPEPPTSLDASWDAMMASMTFTEPNYIANCDTMAAWYAANTGYDTDGFTAGDLTAGSLDVRGQSGTQANPVIVEGIQGGPARWDGNWITFRHCLIDAWGTYAAYATPTYGSGTYGIRFENCTFTSAPATERDCILISSTGGPGDYFGNSFVQCEIVGYSGGLKSYGGCYAKYVYVHDMYESSVAGQHVTCSTARRGRHHLVRCMGTDGGSGVFNVYHEGDMSDLLMQECIMVGMSPNATASYGIDNAKGTDGFAVNSTDMRWIDNLCGKFTNPPNSSIYAGIQFGAFSSTEGLNFGQGGNAAKSGCFFIADGTGW